MTDVPDLSKLIAALPGSSLSFDGGRAYAVDGMTPAMVVKPASQAEVAAALGAANAAGAAVVPFGGGTQQSLGMPPERYDVALDLRRIDRLIEHEPADLTVTVEAGMQLLKLQRLLGEHRQWLPLDPPVAGAATIGGVIATNASGPARLARGTARDLVIGMTVATATGELVKSGGRVVKNVAGYDLAKLHIGALGTTGVIVQVSFKVAPLPIRESCVAARGDATALTGLAEAVQEARLPVTGAVLAKGAAESQWTLGLRFGAGVAAVERALRETEALAGGAAFAGQGLDAQGWRGLLPDYATAAVIVKGSVLPSALEGLATALADAGASVSALPGVGVVHGSWAAAVEPGRLRSLRKLCETNAGALVLEQAPVETKNAIDAWGERPSAFELMRRLKQEMDPGRILNAGRYVGGL